jgi:hypothetical protein
MKLHPRFSHWTAISLLAFGLALPFCAAAESIDFAGLPANLNTPVSPTVGGLTFSNSQQYIMPAVYGPPGTSGNILSGILSNSPFDGRFLTITSSSNMPFSLYNFTAAENTCCSNDNTIGVTGHFYNGPDQTLTFSNLSKSAWQTETLNWSGLSSVQIKSGAAFGGYADFLQFNTTPIPEPEVASLSAVGILVMLALRRRRG